MQLAELLAGDPELDKLADDVICPVCLDLLHEPFQVPIASRIRYVLVLYHNWFVGAKREVGTVQCTQCRRKKKNKQYCESASFLLLMLGSKLNFYSIETHLFNYLGRSTVHKIICEIGNFTVSSRIYPCGKYMIYNLVYYY